MTDQLSNRWSWPSFVTPPTDTAPGQRPMIYSHRYLHSEDPHRLMSGKEPELQSYCSSQLHNNFQLIPTTSWQILSFKYSIYIESYCQQRTQDLARCPPFQHAIYWLNIISGSKNKWQLNKDVRCSWKSHCEAAGRLWLNESLNKYWLLLWKLTMNIQSPISIVKLTHCLLVLPHAKAASINLCQLYY